MPRTRTTPETLAVAHSDRIGYFAVEIAYSPDGVAVAANTQFSYAVVTMNENGKQIREIKEGIPWVDLPTPVKTELKAIYARVLTDAENRGHIGAGDDDGDLT